MPWWKIPPRVFIRSTIWRFSSASYPTLIRWRFIRTSWRGEDNYKYKEKIIRKLNLLINNHPALDEIVYIAMASYIARGYGNAEKFKRELKEHMKDNRPADGVSKMLPISCEADVCSV